MNKLHNHCDWLNKPSASGFLVSSLINGSLCVILIIACITVSYIKLPTDIELSTVRSLLPTILILGPIAFFHYGRYVSIKTKTAEQGAAANP